jgi:hypothetical protein
MPALDQLFKTVEAYDKMNIQYLQFSKIGKVMRHITILADAKVPRDDEFKFKDRAKSLVDRWHSILSSNKGTTNGVDPSSTGVVSPPATNGTAAKADVSPSAPISAAGVNGEAG